MAAYTSANPPRSQSSNRPCTTSTPYGARFSRAPAASSSPSSMQVIGYPRAASGLVAFPVAQPTSSSRSPGSIPVAVIRSWYSSAGYSGRARS